nr:G-type lectin S-receptor-like serine/threonine-protein kinase LECRK3 [Ipomoea batatas]
MTDERRRPWSSSRSGTRATAMAAAFAQVPSVWNEGGGYGRSPRSRSRRWPFRLPSLPMAVFHRRLWPSCRTAMAVRSNGYAVGIFVAGIPERTPVWTANRDTTPIFPSNSTLVLKSDGRLVVEVRQDTISIFPTDGLPISSASMFDNGNFVVYGSGEKIIWQSFENPTNTLLPGQSLLNGKRLVSSASENDDSYGIFIIAMQDDGNLVQYPLQGPYIPQNAYYASNTDRTGNNITLNLDEDGSLYLINSTINIIKNLTPSRGNPGEKTIYIAKIDVDGIFRVYSHPFGHGNWSVSWSTTDDKCAPIGLCRLNAYCTMMDKDAECRCLPGFEFVIPGNWSSGCSRNFSTRSCKATGGGINYEMRAVDNTVWQSNSYALLKTSTKEECMQACLEDCNCDAAQFKDGACGKERLPLIYGRRSVDNSNVALIKVGFLANIGGGLVDQSPESKKQKHKDILVVGISLLAFAILVLAISGMLIHKSRIWRYREISERDNNGQFCKDVGLRAFTYAELQRVTNDFKEELGRGAFGTVFKGVQAEPQKLVAVKRLEKVLEDGEIEFQNEMKAIVLEEWVYNCFEAGEVSKVVGEEEVEKRQVERMVRISLWCIQEEPSLRPSMKKVLLMLEGTVDIPVPPSPTSFLSAV